MNEKTAFWVSLCVFAGTCVAVPAACGQCPGGICVPRVIPGASSAAKPETPPAAVVRIVNTTGAVRSIGSGTLVDKNAQHGLIVSCAHLFEQGVGQVAVVFPDGRSFGAKVLASDRTCDLSALLIVAPSADPVSVAGELPAAGARLDSCGYGEDGRFWTNHGRALRLVCLDQATTADTLELSGTARHGDSGGPVFNDRRELAAVLFGTNGRVVDGTCCLRVRAFLGRFSDRFKSKFKQAPAAQPPQTVVAKPAVPPTQDQSPTLLEKIKQLESDLAKASGDGAAKGALLEKLQAELSSSGADSDSRLAGANHLADNLRKQVGDLNRKLGDALANANLPEPPAPADPVQQVVATGAAAALTALLGIPAGPAGWIATIALPLLGAGGLAGLHKFTAPQPSTGSDPPVSSTLSVQAASAATPPVSPPTVLHHNQYVPYETSTADAAWAKAHSIVGAKYPGAIPYLNMIQGLKDQILSGADSSEV